MSTNLNPQAQLEKHMLKCSLNGPNSDSGPPWAYVPIGRATLMSWGLGRATTSRRGLGALLIIDKTPRFPACWVSLSFVVIFGMSRNLGARCGFSNRCPTKPQHWGLTTPGVRWEAAQAHATPRTHRLPLPLEPQTWIPLEPLEPLLTSHNASEVPSHFSPKDKVL